LAEEEQSVPDGADEPMSGHFARADGTFINWQIVAPSCDEPSWKYVVWDYVHGVTRSIIRGYCSHETMARSVALFVFNREKREEAERQHDGK
jgi:hypothetical protein